MLLCFSPSFAVIGMCQQESHSNEKYIFLHKQKKLPSNTTFHATHHKFDGIHLADLNNNNNNNQKKCMTCALCSDKSNAFHIKFIYDNALCVRASTDDRSIDPAACFQIDQILHFWFSFYRICDTVPLYLVK